MNNFELIHASIMENFEGVERDQRIAALEKSFEVQAFAFASIISMSIMQESGINMGSDITMTDEERANAGRAWDGMVDIKRDIADMFRASLTFFRTHGTFAGFATTAAANPSNMLSFNDLDLLSNVPRNEAGGFLSNVADLSLSDSGRELLNGIVRRDFL